MPRSIPKTLALVALLSLVVVGCSDDDSPTAPTTFAHSRSVVSGDLELTVSTPKASVAFGDAVAIRIELSNVGDTTQTLDFLRGTPARFGNLTLNVDDVDDLNHHAVSEGERDVYELAAGATITANFSWDQNSRTLRRQVDPGLYSLDASVAFDDRDAIVVRDLYIDID